MKFDKNLRRCIRHTKRAKRAETRMDYHVEMARLYLAMWEEADIQAFRELLEGPVIEVELEDVDGE